VEEAEEEEGGEVGPGDILSAIDVYIILCTYLFQFRVTVSLFQFFFTVVVIILNK
jgi:hypothetical protein